MHVERLTVLDCWSTCCDNTVDQLRRWMRWSSQLLETTQYLIEEARRVRACIIVSLCGYACARACVCVCVRVRACVRALLAHYLYLCVRVCSLVCVFLAVGTNSFLIFSFFFRKEDAARQRHWNDCLYLLPKDKGPKIFKIVQNSCWKHSNSEQNHAQQQHHHNYNHM